MKLNGTWTLILSIGVLFGSGITWLCAPTKLVVIDMARAIEEPASCLAHSTLSESAQQKLMARFTKRLPDVIDAYGKSHGVTIVSARVLSTHNNVDITALMIEQTIQRLKHER